MSNQLSAQEIFDRMVEQGDLDIAADTGEELLDAGIDLGAGDEDPAPSAVDDFDEAGGDPTIDEDIDGMDRESFEARVREVKDEAPLDPDLMGPGEFEAYRARLDTEGETWRDMLRQYREEDRARRAKARALKELAEAEAPADPDQTFIDEIADLEATDVIAMAEAIKQGDPDAARRIARKAGATTIRGAF